jgi:hypothetical protein
MKVRLLKKWRKWPIGRVIEIFDTAAKEMIRDNIAESYTGEYPPQKKMKTDFFKPKSIKGNVKD